MFGSRVTAPHRLSNSSDRFGYRWPMNVGVILSAVTIALFGLAPNFALMLLGRVMQGAAAAAT